MGEVTNMMNRTFKLLALVGILALAGTTALAVTEAARFPHGIRINSAANAAVNVFEIDIVAGTAAVTVNKTTGAMAVAGAMTLNGVITLGDGGDTVAINSSAWDISTAGAVTGFTSVGMTGALSGATTIGASGNITTTAGYYVAGGAFAADPTTASYATYGGTGFSWEGAADGNEGSVTFTSVTGADRNWIFGAIGDFQIAGAPAATLGVVNSASYGGTGILFEGADDASETTLTAEDATADNGFILGAAGDFRIPGAPLADPATANMASYGGTGMIFEGGANGFETVITVADPGADNTYTLGATGDFTAPGTLFGGTGVTATVGWIAATNGTVSAADLDGFNGNAGELVVGVPAVRMVAIAGTTGAQDVLVSNCEAANWVMGGAVPPVQVLDNATWRVTAGSVQLTFGDVGVGDATATTAAIGATDATDDEWLFVWAMSSKPILANSLTATVNDATGTAEAVPAITVANQWQLLRIPLPAVNANKDSFTAVVFTSNHATDLDNAVIHFDQLIKVDGAEATAIGQDVVNQPAGIRSGYSFVTAAPGAWTALVEWTDYFIDYANDAAYWLTDQSANSDVLLLATTN